MHSSWLTYLLCCFLYWKHFKQSREAFHNVVTFCSSLLFQKAEQPLDPTKPPYTISVAAIRLAADTIKIKAKLSQMDLFVLKPTSKLTPSLLCLLFLLQCSQMELNILSLSLWWCTLPSPLSLWFPYANKDLCLFSFTPDLVGRKASDRTILEQPSPKRQRDFRLKSQAGCSEYVTQVVQTANSVGIHQWAHTHIRSLSLEVEQHRH